ncbi:MAG TPA: hypothetical protein DCZ03_15695 [Gammaproteobacteria bacterium]|nr:hypothetical protein [Gammaproteobacteria bacterium]
MSRTRKSLLACAITAGVFFFFVSVFYRYQQGMAINGYVRFLLMHVVLAALIVEVIVLPLFIILRRIHLDNLIVYLLLGWFLGEMIFGYLHAVPNAPLYGAIGGVLAAIAFWRTNTKIGYPHQQP